LVTGTARKLLTAGGVNNERVFTGRRDTLSVLVGWKEEWARLTWRGFGRRVYRRLSHDRVKVVEVW
jgi:hypothetical protein